MPIVPGPSDRPQLTAAPRSAVQTVQCVWMRSRTARCCCCCHASIYFIGTVCCRGFKRKCAARSAVLTCVASSVSVGCKVFVSYGIAQGVREGTGAVVRVASHPLERTAYGEHISLLLEDPCCVLFVRGCCILHFSRKCTRYQDGFACHSVMEDHFSKQDILCFCQKQGIEMIDIILKSIVWSAKSRVQFSFPVGGKPI